MRNRIIPGRGGLRKAVIPPPPPGPARREARVPISANGWVGVGEDRHGIALLDLSVHGFRARTDTEIAIGSEVIVWLPAYGEVRAQIRWSLCGFFGGLFLDRAVTASCDARRELEAMAGDVRAA